MRWEDQGGGYYAAYVEATETLLADKDSSGVTVGLNSTHSSTLSVADTVNYPVDTRFPVVFLAIRARPWTNEWQAQSTVPMFSYHVEHRVRLSAPGMTDHVEQILTSPDTTQLGVWSDFAWAIESWDDAAPTWRTKAESGDVTVTIEVPDQSPSTTDLNYDIDVDFAALVWYTTATGLYVPPAGGAWTVGHVS